MSSLYNLYRNGNIHANAIGNCITTAGDMDPMAPFQRKRSPRRAAKCVIAPSVTARQPNLDRLGLRHPAQSWRKWAAVDGNFNMDLTMRS